ncbi:MAG: hypothetical protein KDC92_05740 [Bacteroidetes bacterium]|nr:hypothetical protein [Bacteroidota bacterium]
MKVLPSLSVFGFLAFAIFSGCKQEAPENPTRMGDSLYFSGRYWTIKKYENAQWGPGPNYFSAHPSDVWVDSKDQLHLTISNRDNKWFSTEVVSTDTFGYGTYRFTIIGDMYEIPKNVTLGLFTWDDNTFLEAANSEVDIELSKWGADTVQTLNYAVQPVAFGPTFPERNYRAQLEDPTIVDGVTTHEFTWKPNIITWRSYAGEERTDKNLIAEWSFDDSMPARVKNENGNSSKPITVPKPGNTTNARMNYWIHTWINAAPTSGEREEVIIKSFEFEPL